MDREKLLGWASPDTIKENYFSFCKTAAENDKVFAGFKVHPHYTTILEHVTLNEANSYLNIIKEEYEHLYEILDIFRVNDEVGGPRIHTFPNVGDFSTTTFRYVKTLGDLLKHFGDLQDLHVVEIGGGYGGQCTITNEHEDFASWTILDLETAAQLQNRYFKEMGLDDRCSAMTIDEWETLEARPIDLVISNYAFSECVKETQDRYVERVIKHAKRGYFQINPGAHGTYDRGQSLKMLMSIAQDAKWWGGPLPDMPANLRYPQNFIFAFDKGV